MPSLVGSEMCIRDRGIGDLAGFDEALGIGVHVKRFGGNAVSYTHLTLPTICSV